MSIYTDFRRRVQATLMERHRRRGVSALQGVTETDRDAACVQPLCDLVETLTERVKALEDLHGARPRELLLESALVTLSHGNVPAGLEARFADLLLQGSTLAEALSRVAKEAKE